MANSANRGLEAEKYVVNAIKNFIKQGAVFFNNFQIVHLVHSNENDIYYKEGIDILVIFKNGLSIPLQIKSNPRGVNKHYSRHPFVPYVFVVSHQPLSNGGKWLERDLRSFLNWAIARALPN